MTCGSIPGQPKATNGMDGEVILIFIRDPRLARLICRTVQTAGYRCSSVSRWDDCAIGEAVSLAVVWLVPSLGFGKDLDCLQTHPTLPLLLLGDSRHELQHAADQAETAGIRRVRSLVVPQQLAQIIGVIGALLRGEPVSGDSGEEPPPSSQRQ